MGTRRRTRSRKYSVRPPGAPVPKARRGSPLADDCCCYTLKSAPCGARISKINRERGVRYCWRHRNKKCRKTLEGPVASRRKCHSSSSSSSAHLPPLFEDGAEEAPKTPSKGKEEANTPKDKANELSPMVLRNVPLKYQRSSSKEREVTPVRRKQGTPKMPTDIQEAPTVMKKPGTVTADAPTVLRPSKPLPPVLQLQQPQSSEPTEDDIVNVTNFFLGKHPSNMEGPIATLNDAVSAPFVSFYLDETKSNRDPTYKDLHHPRKDKFTRKIVRIVEELHRRGELERLKAEPTRGKLHWNRVADEKHKGRTRLLFDKGEFVYRLKPS